MRSAAILRNVVVIPYRNFLTTYPYHFKGQEIQEGMKEGSKEGRMEGNTIRKDFLTPEDGPIGCPKTSVSNYHYLLRNRKNAELNLRIIYNFFFTMLKMSASYSDKVEGHWRKFM